ncbi:MAG TPA: hypothetical protein VMI35_03240 [Puia sp.]|nr:hypothetical protein [Puia sp.]
MKKQLLWQAVVGICLILPAAGVYAQDTTFKTLPSVTVTATSKVSHDVAKAFEASFPDAENPAWYKLDKNYLVKFMTKDQSNRALYKNNGMLIYHIRYGHEQNLPDDVRKIVKSSYYDYSIMSVIYVNQDQRDIWVVNVEDSQKIILVRVENGEIEEVEKYNKS